MYYHTEDETALLLVRMLKRHGKTRARVSREAIKWMAGRQQLRHLFLSRLASCLEDFGWVLIELDSGGFGFVAIRALEGAERVVARRLHSQEEILEIDEEGVDWEAVKSEIGLEYYEG